MARPKKFTEERLLVGIRLEKTLYDNINIYCSNAGLSLSDFFMRQAKVFEELCELRPKAFEELDKISKNNDSTPAELQALILQDYLNYRAKYKKTKNF